MKEIKEMLLCCLCLGVLIVLFAQEASCAETNSATSAILQRKGLEGCVARGDTNGLTLIITDEVASSLPVLEGLPVYNLYAPDRRMTNLKGIDGLRALRTLHISENSINDLAPLRNIPLVSLDIAGNPVADLSPVLQPCLRELWMSGTEISDLACLSNIPLTRLELGVDPCVESFHSITNMPLKRLSFLQRPGMMMADDRRGVRGSGLD